MAYAGERVRVFSRIKGYDGGPITGADGVAVKLTIYDLDNSILETDIAMTWNAVGNADGPYWFYDWPSDVEPGTYRTRVNAEGGSPVVDAWEFGRVRLRENPVPV